MVVALGSTSETQKENHKSQKVSNLVQPLSNLISPKSQCLAGVSNLSNLFLYIKCF